MCEALFAPSTNRKRWWSGPFGFSGSCDGFPGSTSADVMTTGPTERKKSWTKSWIEAVRIWLKNVTELPLHVLYEENKQSITVPEWCCTFLESRCVFSCSALRLTSIIMTLSRMDRGLGPVPTELETATRSVTRLMNAPCSWTFSRINRLDRRFTASELKCTALRPEPGFKEKGRNMVNGGI